MPKLYLEPPKGGIEREVPYNDLEFLRKGLLDQEMATHLIGETEYPTLEHLLSEMEDHPVAGNNQLLNENVRLHFNRAAINPLAFFDEPGKVLFSIRSHLPNSTNPRDPAEVKSAILNHIDPYTRGFSSIDYVLLSPENHDRALSFVTDRTGLRNHLTKVMEKVSEDTEARDLVDAVIRTAIKRRASDIHFEQLTGRARIRYRIDGSMVEVKSLDSVQRLIAVLKVMAAMEPSEKRRPQDGRIDFDKDKVKAQPVLSGYHLRLSTMPLSREIKGERTEKMVVRLLSSNPRLLDLKSLGYPDSIRDSIEKMSQSPYGLILVTGPTGSGKSTTLYSILNDLNKTDVNIVTIEDPVEMQIEGLNQSQTNSAVGWGFSTSLRTYLRQDPDIIFVGEMRDEETVKAAMDASKTGHLVLSTMHTNDAPSSLLRLRKMGADDADIQTCLTGVVAQRLVRRLCPDCREPYNATETIRKLTDGKVSVPDLTFYGPPRDNSECGTCEGLRYYGRTVVPEIWILGDEEKDLIGRGEQSIIPYQQLAAQKGMPTLLDSGLSLVLQGKTSLSEVLGQVVPIRQFVDRSDKVERIIKEYQDPK